MSVWMMTFRPISVYVIKLDTSSTHMNNAYAHPPSTVHSSPRTTNLVILWARNWQYNSRLLEVENCMCPNASICRCLNKSYILFAKF